MKRAFFLLQYITLALAVVTVFSSPTFAQQPCKERIRSWAENEIVPVLRVWKSEFDAKLSSEELSQLNQLRIKARGLQERKEKLMKRLAEARKLQDEASIDDLRAEMRSLRNDAEDLGEELIPLARAHRDDLITLGKKTQPQVREWRSTLRAMISECSSSIPADAADRWEKYQRFLRDFLSDEHQETPRMKKRAAARFLLWDGRTPTSSESNAPVRGPVDVINLPGTFSLAQCSPNPVIGSGTTMRFSLSKADHVKISLLNMQGSEVDVIADRQFAAGTNVIEYAVGTLPSGQYSVRLVCSEGMLYTAMIIAR